MINLDKSTRTLLNEVRLPFSLKFNFLDEYPYELNKEVVHSYMRVDQLARQISDSDKGWKLICLFNAIANPLDITDKEYIYIPTDFNRAINWLTNRVLKKG
jgi:hypothetical protein